MHKIYGAALSVISWLGPARDESGKAFELIHRHSPMRPHLQQIDKDFQTPSRHASWAAFGQLCDRTYWERGWIIQEILTQPHQQVLTCGLDSAVITPFLLLVLYLNGLEWYHFKRGSGHRWWERFSALLPDSPQCLDS